MRLECILSKEEKDLRLGLLETLGGSHSLGGSLPSLSLLFSGLTVDPSLPLLLQLIVGPTQVCHFRTGSRVSFAFLHLCSRYLHVVPSLPSSFLAIFCNRLPYTVATFFGTTHLLDSEFFRLMTNERTVFRCSDLYV